MACSPLAQRIHLPSFPVFIAPCPGVKPLGLEDKMGPSTWGYLHGKLQIRAAGKNAATPVAPFETARMEGRSEGTASPGMTAREATHQVECRYLFWWGY